MDLSERQMEAMVIHVKIWREHAKQLQRWRDELLAHQQQRGAEPLAIVESLQSLLRANTALYAVHLLVTWTIATPLQIGIALVESFPQHQLDCFTLADIAAEMLEERRRQQGQAAAQ